jgi:hypothetical protein
VRSLFAVDSRTVCGRKTTECLPYSRCSDLKSVPDRDERAPDRRYRRCSMRYRRIDLIRREERGERREEARAMRRCRPAMGSSRRGDATNRGEGGGGGAQKPEGRWLERKITWRTKECVVQGRTGDGRDGDGDGDGDGGGGGGGKATAKATVRVESQNEKPANLREKAPKNSGEGAASLYTAEPRGIRQESLGA